MQGGFDVNGAKLAHSRWFFTALDITTLILPLTQFFCNNLLTWTTRLAMTQHLCAVQTGNLQCYCATIIRVNLERPCPPLLSTPRSITPERSRPQSLARDRDHRSTIISTRWCERAHYYPLSPPPNPRCSIHESTNAPGRTPRFTHVTD